MPYSYGAGTWPRQWQRQTLKPLIPRWQRWVLAYEARGWTARADLRYHAPRMPAISIPPPVCALEPHSFFGACVTTLDEDGGACGDVWFTAGVVNLTNAKRGCGPMSRA